MIFEHFLRFVLRSFKLLRDLLDSFRNHAKFVVRWSGHFLLEVHQVFFTKLRHLENHEKTCFRASLEPQGSRDPPCVKERKILFRIALTRALYDQMAPQLCPCYVPQKNSKVSQVFFADCWGHYGVILGTFLDGLGHALSFAFLF